MNREPIELVLPRMARRLHRSLVRFQAGDLDQEAFTQKFEDLLSGQYAWLARRGVPEMDAAVAIHAAVLLLSAPGLRTEAESLRVPLEVIEARAISGAAADIAENHGLSESKAYDRISAIVSRYVD